MNLFLFIALVLIFTIIVWKFIERIRIPWVFAAMFLWLILSIYNPFISITSWNVFKFMADMWMYLLLFIIGLELDIKNMFKQWIFVPKLSLLLFLAESIIGTIFIYYVFDMSIWISILVASSFATVWEAILLPILDEFNIIKTKFWQLILWVWTIDDIIELITIIYASIVLWASIWGGMFSIWTILLIIAGLFLVPILLQVFKSKIHLWKFKEVSVLFLFWLIVLFIFLWVWAFVEATALWAILAGITIKILMSEENAKKFESIIRTIAYGWFVPLFFLYVGSEINLEYLLSSPWLILSILFITSGTKILVSYLWAKSRLWTKKSILLGIWLSAKFSTSIAVLTMLFAKGIISWNIYSVLIWAMIVSKFVIPVSFSVLLKKWKLKFKSV